MHIVKRDQETYQYVNMCNLCSYAQFLQAQSQRLRKHNSPYATYN